MNDSGSILVVDDEVPIRRLLHTTLQVHRYRVVEVGSAAAALAALRADATFDLVLLDLGLPDGDGLDVLRTLRSFSNVPVIVLSSRDHEQVKVQALDHGADDYVTKPFGAAELMARIRTALRHRLHEQGTQPLYHAGNVRVDLVRREVRKDGQALRLSPKEYDILEQLVRHAGKVLTHRHLLKTVWGSELDADVQYLRVYIRQLRGKLETEPERPTLILTESGVGYRLREPEAAR